MPKRTRSKSRRRTRKVFRRRRAVTKYRGRRTRSRKPRIEKLWPLISTKCLEYVDTFSPIITIPVAARVSGNLYKVNDLLYTNQQLTLTPAVIPGMTEYNAMWANFRIVAVKATCTFTNLNITSPQPHYVGMCWYSYPHPVNTQAILQTSTYPEIRQLGTGNPNWVEKDMKCYPMGQTTISMYRKLANIVGNKNEYASDIGWQGVTNGGVPSTLPFGVYLNVWASTFQDVSPGTGAYIPIKVTLQLYIRYSNREIENN